MVMSQYWQLAGVSITLIFLVLAMSVYRYNKRPHDDSVEIDQDPGYGKDTYHNSIDNEPEDLVETLGTLFSKDDKSKKPLITFADFLGRVMAPGKPDDLVLQDAHLLERRMTYYEHFKKQHEWDFTLDQFLHKCESGAWAARFTD